METTAERASAWAGVASPAVALGTMLLATLLSPEFAWTGNALSNLGGAGGPENPASTTLTRLLFNGGLILGGLFGLAFGYVLLRRARNLVERLGVLAFGASITAMGLVGVFPQDTDPHFPVAVAFYLLLSVALWVYGLGNLLAGERRRGALTVVLGFLNIGAWVAWGLGGDVTRPGLAIPEIAGALILAGWALWTARRFLAAPSKAGPASADLAQ